VNGSVDDVDAGRRGQTRSRCAPSTDARTSVVRSNSTDSSRVEAHADEVRRRDVRVVELLRQVRLARRGRRALALG
jgi:hypothetical protein